MRSAATTLWVRYTAVRPRAPGKAFQERQTRGTTESNSARGAPTVLWIDE